jgi:uncharacterized protein (DUF433 family)
MLNTPAIIDIPLHMDEHGAIRVSGTRVTLETLINYYKQGESPDDLYEGFPTVPLADIHVVIAYYLRNQVEVDAYLQGRNDLAERVRQEVEASYTPEQRAAHDRLRTRILEKRAQGNG